MKFSQFVNHFIALLVVANPLSALPAVLKITRSKTLAEKKRIGLTTAFAVMVILVLSTWIGTPFLMILGIKIPAFQMAGGVILFLMALSMLSAEESPIKQTAEEQKEKFAADTGAIVPLAIPIIAGPGAISTIIVSVSEYPTVFDMVILTFSAILVSIVMGILLYFASHVERVFGHSGINIINRLGGLVLTAISIQNFCTGALAIFPGLGAPT